MLPTELTRYLHDARLTVESLDGTTRSLCLRVEKDIGPERGIARFAGVSFVCLPMSLTGGALRARPVGEADASFRSCARVAPEAFDRDDMVYELIDEDGVAHFIVAKSVRYDVLPPAAGPPP